MLDKRYFPWYNRQALKREGTKTEVLEKAWNRLNSEKEGSRGYEDELKNRKEETAEARWPTGKKFKTLKKEI